VYVGVYVVLCCFDHIRFFLTIRGEGFFILHDTLLLWHPHEGSTFDHVLHKGFWT
jgi:hypothetical protein